jgi:hypothetical protein
MTSTVSAAGLMEPRHRYAWPAGSRTMLAEPTSMQRQAFELIGAPIPLTLK